MLFQFYNQEDNIDCGIACLRMIAHHHYGKEYSSQILRKGTIFSSIGMSLEELRKVAGKVGFRTLIVQVSLEKLLEAPLPCVVHFRGYHFVVLYGFRKNGNLKTKDFFVADPAVGLLELDEEIFKEQWFIKNKPEGVACLFELNEDAIVTELQF